LVKEHKSEEAIKAYNRALSFDPTLHNVWFNKAHAQLKIGDESGARESLMKTIELDDTIIAAKHMLKVNFRC
jgi:tetratricopeptide (TPR) repeat protein